MGESTSFGALYDPGKTTVPSGRLESHFHPKKPLLRDDQAVAAAEHCLYCHDAPCIEACPTRIDIPSFIRKITTGNLTGSARTILSANILGLSCATVCPTEVLCEGSCVYNAQGVEPVQIGKLQKYATERAYARGQRFFERGADNGHRVALVGAGPASLACAHELATLGYQCTLFEARDVPGGLNSAGVAPYKLKFEDALREVEYVLGIGGIEIRTGVSVGKDVSFAQLSEDYDAVFVGVGLGADGAMGIEGEDLDGVVGAVALIERLKTEPGFSLAHVKSAVVIGGGNTAIDAVHELVGVGVESVTLVYRRGAESMPGYKHEWEASQILGAKASWFTVPNRLEGDAGHVKAVHCLHTEAGAPDANGRRGVVVTDRELTIEADLVVQAIGQGTLAALFDAVDGVEFERGKLTIDEETGATGNPAIFAGGDCVNGGKEVVNASADGKRAAHGIHAYISNKP